MVMEKRARVNLFSLLALSLLLILSIYFVFAAIANAPAGLTISRNASTLYDEGNFSVNWTQDTSSGDGVANYTLFIYSNGVLYNTTAKNDSALGFTFNNHTEANYTFFIIALNLTSNQKNATSNISIYVDRTAPLINLTTATAPYTNGTFKQNTNTLTLNISLTDGLSGLTGSACFININGTNQTISASNGWCNTTNGNLTGLSDGNNTIRIYANDTVGSLALNNSFVVQIDTSAPTATLPAYTNGTSKKNTGTLTLNISLTDTGSGLTGSACFVDINGTNQTIFADSGWCNTTNGNLTGLSDGNQTIKVYANDTIGNLALNNSFVVQIDTTVPLSSSSCTPSSVYTGDVVTCTCSGSDATSGVASTSDSSTPSTSGSGSFSYGCTVTDNAGNSASSTAAYTVSQSLSPRGSSGGGGSSTTDFWARGTYSISDGEVEQGHSMNVLEKQRVKLKVSSEFHYVGVRELTQTTAKIEVSSTPQEKVLSIGEEWKVEVTGDNFYDLNVKLNSIQNSQASVFVQSIHEALPVVPNSESETTNTNPSDAGGSVTGNAVTDQEISSGQGSSWWIWALIIIVIVAAFVFWLIFGKKKKK
ncbi:MAG: hypothetical protein AABW63_02565 [Nanoarchaeota archaeon]